MSRPGPAQIEYGLSAAAPKVSLERLAENFATRPMPTRAAMAEMFATRRAEFIAEAITLIRSGKSGLESFVVEPAGAPARHAVSLEPCQQPLRRLGRPVGDGQPCHPRREQGMDDGMCRATSTDHDDLDALQGAEQGPHPAAHDGVVVGEEHADGRHGGMMARSEPSGTG